MSGPEGPAQAGTTAPPPPPPVVPPQMTQPTAPSPMNSMLNSYSRAELFVLGGALLVILCDLLFDVIIDRYPFSDITSAAAVAALLAVVLGSRMSDGARTARMIAVGAVGVALYMAARDLYFDVRALSGGIDVTYLLGALAMYVGVALMAWGAWQLWSTRSA